MAARKKITKKRTTRKAPAVASDKPVVSGPKPFDASKLVGKGRRNSIYQPVIDQMAALKPGQGFEVAPFAGQTVKQLSASLGSVFLRQAPDAPKGHRWAKATLKDGSGVLIYAKKV